MCKILINLFSILIKRVLNKRDKKSTKSLKRAGKVFSNFILMFNQQIKTDNGEPEKKKIKQPIPELCDDLVREITFFIEIDEFLYFINTSLENPIDPIKRRDLNRIKMIKDIERIFTEIFWERRFKFEFPYGLDYPKILFNEESLIDITSWKERIENVLEKVEEFRNHSLWKRFDNKLYEPGNELLLLLYIKLNKGFTSHVKIIKYVTRNSELNDNFLIGLINIKFFIGDFSEVLIIMNSIKKFKKKKFVKDFLLDLYIDSNYAEDYFFPDSTKLLDLIIESFSLSLYKSYPMREVLKDKEILLKFLINGIIFPVDIYNEAWEDVNWRSKAAKIDTEIKSVIYSEQFNIQKIAPTKEDMMYSKEFYNNLSEPLKRSYTYNLFLVRAGSPHFFYVLSPKFKHDLYFKVISGEKKYTKKDIKILKERFYLLTTLSK